MPKPVYLAPTESKKGRTRSPAYPSFDLKTAIEKIEKAYDGNDQHPMPPEVLASHLKYTPTSSSFLQAISTLKQFGLLEDSGLRENRRLTVSGLALDILLSEEDSPKRAAAIKTAALLPKVHRELWDKYGGKIPAKDDGIRFYLLRERPDGVFNRSQVDGIIAEFRATIGFSGITESDKIAEQEAVEEEYLEEAYASNMSPILSSMWAANTTKPPAIQQHQANPQMRDLPITLPSLAIATLRVPFPMSEADFNALETLLKALKPALTTAAPNPAESAGSQPAIG